MKEKENNKSREVWIDITRGIGILFVVLGHTQPVFIKFIYGFHVPMFFMISGYLWKEGTKSYKYTIGKNLKRYIVPYFVLCIINLGISIANQLLTNKDLMVGKYLIGILYSRGSTQWMPDCSPLWYLTCIFITLLIMETVYRFIKRKSIRFLLIGLLVTVGGTLSFFETFKLPWNIDTAFMALLFFVVGNEVKKRKLLPKMREKKKWIQGLIVVALFLVGNMSIYFNPIGLVSFDGNRYGNVLLMIVGALSICYIIFFLCYQIHWKGVVSRYLAWLGQHTIFFMGFDYFSGKISVMLLDKMGLMNSILIFVLKCIILTIGCLIWNWAVSKIRNRSIRTVMSI